MSDQVERAMAQWINAMGESAQTVGSQIPDVLQQILWWEAFKTSGLILLTLFLAVGGLCLLIFMVNANRTHVGPEMKHHVKPPFGEGWFIGTGGVTLLFTIAGLYNIAKIIRIWFFPKYFLFQYVTAYYQNLN